MPVRFQVDPDFYDHPKSIGLSDAAVALWTRAGSYSAAKLTDGFVAEHVLVTLSRVPDEASAELVGRGLWKRVRGGFQFHQWEQRNLTRARIESEREADRDRKRTNRNGNRVTHKRLCNGCGSQFVTTRSDAKYCSNSCRQKAHREKNPQADTENVHPDSTPESDRSPTGVRPLSVSVSVSESVSGSGRPPDTPTVDPPPPRCPDHIDDPNPPPCGPCADARRAHQAWQRDQAAADATARSATARGRAAAARAAIDACRLCDATGYRGKALCHHPADDPGDRARRGAAAASAAIRRRTASSEVPKPEDPAQPTQETR